MQTKLFLNWKCLFAFSLLFNFMHVHAKGDNIDSLINLLKVYEADTNRVRILNQLARATLREQVKKAKTYGEEALPLAKLLYDVEGQKESLILLANAYYTLGLYDQSLQASVDNAELCRQLGQQEEEVDATLLIANNLYVTGKVDSAKGYYQKSWDISKKIGYRNGSAQSAKSIGDVYESKGQYDQALEKYQLSLKISTEIDNKESQLVALNAIGIIYDYTGKIDSALLKYFQVLQMAEEQGNIRLEGTANSNISYLFRLKKNQDYEKALTYSFKSLACYEKIDYTKGIAHCYQDIAYTYRKQNKLEEATKYYQKAIVIRKEIGDKRGLSFSYNSFGWVYMEKNNLLKARQCFEEGLRYSEEIGLKRGISNSLRYLGNLNMELEDYPQALKYLNRSKEMALEINDLKDLGNIYSNFVKYHEENGNYKEALAYHKLHMGAQDSLLEKDQSKKIAEVQALYETEKQEKQILEKESDIRILEANNEKVVMQRNGIFGGAIILAILGFIIYKYFRISKDRNEKKEFTEALLYTQEEERKRIARDLHDGVGQSLLLIKKQLESTSADAIGNQELISTTLEEVRSISQNLHPFQLEKFGLTATIRNVILKIESSTDIFITHEIEEIDKLLSKNSQINLYRTIQEALNNIVKHAKATAANIIISRSEKSIIILIRDNGIGISKEHDSNKSQGLGLRTMHERMSSIGGALKISNIDPKGTLIDISIPV